MKESCNDQSMFLIFSIFIAMVIGGVFKEINKKTGIPYFPMLFAFGTIFGYYGTQNPIYYE
jgi:hypothetical protein